MFPLLLLLLTPQDFNLNSMDSFRHGTKDDIRIVMNKVHKTFKCDKNSIFVAANGGDLTFTGPCRELHIEGDGNQVTIDTVAMVVITGADNVVHVNQSIPRIGIHGKRDHVFHPAPPPAAGAAPPPTE